MQKVKLMPPIEGYEDVAENRIPEHGDYVLYAGGPTVHEYSAQVHQRSHRLCLTPKVAWASKHGLEVGAVYHSDHKGVHWNPYLVAEDGAYELSPNGFSSKLLSSDDLFLLSSFEDHRKVINADGSLVDDEVGGNYTLLGDKWISKADLREFVSQSGLACGPRCCCDNCIPF